MKKLSTTIPLNCIDKVLLSYELAHQRLNFHVILSIQGKLGYERLKQELLHVLQHYPTLRTVLRTRLFGHFRKVEEISEASILEVRDLGKW